MAKGNLRILVIGSKGQLATALLDELPRQGFATEYAARPDYDLTEPASLSSAIQRFKPDIVVNPAAYTAVDKAEDEPDAAYAINRDGARAVAEAAAAAGAAIVHLSTDYVFDGEQRHAYAETDAVSPVSVYGASKLAGEVAVAAANPRHVILRAAWVFGPHGANFVKTMLRLAGQREEIRVVNDQRGAPTSAADLARAIARMARRIALAKAGGPEFGVFHIASEGEASWHEVASMVVEAARDKGLSDAAVLPISTADYPTRARRPAFSKLSTEKLKQTYGISLPHWRDAVGECLNELLGTA